MKNIVVRCPLISWSIEQWVCVKSQASSLVVFCKCSPSEFIPTMATDSILDPKTSRATMRAFMKEFLSSHHNSCKLILHYRNTFEDPTNQFCNLFRKLSCQNNNRKMSEILSLSGSICGREEMDPLFYQLKHLHKSIKLIYMQLM